MIEFIDNPPMLLAFYAAITFGYHRFVAPLYVKRTWTQEYQLRKSEIGVMKSGNYETEVFSLEHAKNLAGEAAHNAAVRHFWIAVFWPVVLLVIVGFWILVALLYYVVYPLVELVVGDSKRRRDTAYDSWAEQLN